MEIAAPQMPEINHASNLAFPGSVMVQDDSFAHLMIRLREGDEAAATEVFRRFLRRLIVLASHQFDSWIRHRVDVEDVVQPAYRSFFAGQGEERFELADRDSLWGLLAVIGGSCRGRAE
jgi:RNA polymerase sigma-70 factor (ECF subfamily)